jgi:hypothetical protein
VSLAIDILKADPKIQDVAGNPLRDWAVDVLRLDSPVPISEAAQNQLRTSREMVYDSSYDKAAVEAIRKINESESPPAPKGTATP